MIRKDLIEQELNSVNKIYNDTLVFNNTKLCKGQINRLFKDYFVVELCEYCYDSEPVFDTDELKLLFKMYMDYKNIYLERNTTKCVYSKGNYTKEELKTAYDKVLKMYQEYEPERLEYYNWIEVYCKGNWDMTQEYVDNYAKRTLESFCGKVNKDRVYIEKHNDIISIYIYARDVDMMDYWITLCKKGCGC